MIYHITNKKEWDKALREYIYIPDSFREEGFIHCSPAEKVSDTLNNFFKGKNDLLLLSIDESKVQDRIIREDLYGHKFNFPHIYGKLNLDAVIKVTEITADAEGKFLLPELI